MSARHYIDEVGDTVAVFAAATAPPTGAAVPAPSHPLDYHPSQTPDPVGSGSGTSDDSFSEKRDNRTLSPGDSPYVSDRSKLGTVDDIHSHHKFEGDTEDTLNYASRRNSGGSVNDASVSVAAEVATKPASIAKLFRYATKMDLLLNFIGVLASGTAGATQPLMTIVFGNLTTSFLQYQSAVTSNDAALKASALVTLKQKVDEDALLLVYIGIAMFACTYIYMATWVYTGEVITRRIRETYLTAVLRQEIAYFDILGAGEVTTRLQSDIALIQEGISDKIPMSVMFLATFVSGFVVAFIKSWKLALAMSSIVPMVIIAGAAMNALISRAQQIELDKVAHGASLAEEAMSTVRTAKAFGMEQRLTDLYDESNRSATEIGVHKAVVQGVGLGVFFFVIYSGYALAFYFGSKLIASGDIPGGTVMNVIFSIFIGAFSMALLAPNLQALSYALGAGGKVFETIDRTPLIDSSSEEGLRPDTCEGYIELDRIDFAYPARPDVPILHDYSVEIPKGKVTALVGASGSGKSTIIGLIERFYDPDEGFVFLDGVDIRELNLKWLRTQIGLVSQEPVLFATTIMGNIEQGLINSPYEDLPQNQREELVIEAAKQANAHSFIMQLPMQYQTMVGERGFLLSGGQKQRIAIARAIVKNPRILLLDEATSALDTTSEGVVQDALDKASRGRTTITIAHRLSTIKKADNIIVMGKGKILEQGTHESLLATPGSAYASLVDAQKIRANTDTDFNAYDDDDEFQELQLRLAQEAAMSKEDLGRSRSRASSRGRSMSRLSVRSVTRSISSLILAGQDDDEDEEDQRVQGMWYLFYRMAMINKDQIFTHYIPGFIGAIASGAVYPAFSILFGIALQTFSECAAPITPPGGSCPEPYRSHMRHGADRNALWFFIISILATIAVAIQVLTLALGSSTLVERLRRKMLLAYLHADVSYFDEEAHSSGILSASLADDTQKINSLVGSCLGTILQSLSTLIVGFIIALTQSWRLALVVIACTPLTLSAGFVRLKLVVLKDAKIKKAHERASQSACEATAAIRTVASLTREQSCIDTYRAALIGPAKITYNTAFYGNILYSTSQALAFGVIALGFWYGSRLIIHDQLTIKTFFTVLTAVVFGSIQAGNVFNFVPDISNALTAADHAIRLLDYRPDIDSEATDGIILEHCEGHVTFENVHFRYPSRSGMRVLRGIDMDIRPGTYCALVGGSGCGKSTSIQLIERFYDPIVGSIYIDGHDIADLNLKHMRKHMALVSQEPTLYDGTIAFNLRLGAFEEADDVTEEMLRKAAADANILSFIESLPDGFETQVGGKGTQLSGGQKQRIAIARALIRDPKILLLDEATSALDSESEKVVQEALDKAARGRTTIAIAHRLSTISRADRIFCLKDGVVSEQGDHRSLLALNGLYAELVHLQALQKEEPEK